MRLKLITIFWMLVILVGEAAGQRILSAKRALASSQLECSRDAGAVPGNANSLFADGLSRFPMAPESALQVFESGCELQARVLQGYSATIRINAELPDTSRHGEFDVITPLLQFEVNNLQNPQGFMTAINNTNYTIHYKSTTQIDGRLVHVYELKPRERRVGLFEGRMFLDAFTGSLVRDEGKLVKTPSLVLTKVEFVRDYVTVNGFIFPEHVHSVASIRVIGRAVVDIYHFNYLPAATSHGCSCRADSS